MVLEVKFAIRLVRFKNGETYYMLTRADTRMPLYYPTLFATTQIRNNSKSSATIAANLVAIKIFMNWCVAHRLDLESRLSQHQFLTLVEIESLSRYTQFASDKTRTENRKNRLVSRPNVRERARTEIRNREASVNGNTQYIRLTYIAYYLKWLSETIIERDAKRISPNDATSIQKMIENILARRHKKSNRSLINTRRGLDESQREELLRITTPDVEDNPFQEPSVRLRNELIVLMLYHLGVRDGELLNIRIADIDFQQHTLLVARRPDDPDDPRAYQPKVKTMDRLIPLRDTLVAKITRYITEHRRQYPTARRHDYLFVTHKAGPSCGMPLSLAHVQKMFRQIRKSSPDKLSNLSAHVLRHTWNDRFSELADTQEMATATEEKTRSFLMGWKEGSGTASTYTRRHTERKGHEAALKLQNNLKE